MNTDTPRTDSNAGYYCGYGIQKNPDLYIDPKGPFVSANFARELERENARLRELITLLEIAGDGMSEECASQPHIAKWDAARGEVGSFLRSAKQELAMQKLADEAQERGEYMVQYRAMRSLLLRIHSARVGMNEEAVIAALNNVDAFFREPNHN